MGKLIFPDDIRGGRKIWILALPFLVVAFFLVGQIVVLLIAKTLGLITRETVETYPTVLYLILGSFSLVALIFVLWLKAFEKSSLASVGLSCSEQSKVLYVRGYALGLLMGATAVCGIYLLGGYSLESETDLSLADLVPILILMVSFIVQSGTEELIFRGWMMSRIAARFGIWVGIIANSLLFALMHVEIGALQSTAPVMIVLFAIMTFLFAVFLSLLVVREKSIWGASAWHAAWNWIFITWFGLPTTGIELGLTPLVADLAVSEGSPEWLTGGLAGPEGSVVTLVILIVGCLILIRRELNIAKA